MLTFKFREDKVGNEIFARPFVSLKLSSPYGEAEVFALIDSGADRTIIPSYFAEELHLEIGHRIETRGLGGVAEGYESTITIKFSDIQGEREVIEDVPVYVLDDFEDVIIGRKKIFEMFRVIFEQLNNRILLERME